MKALVLLARGFHLGYLGCYGNDWIETPTLDRLAAEGVVFDQHYADCPDPAGACRAWRTGRFAFPLPPGTTPAESVETPELIATLKAAGVGTFLMTDVSRPTPPGFIDRWEQVVTVPGLGGNAGREQTLTAFGESLERLSTSGQWLFWVDLATLLPPWDAPSEFAARYFEGSAEEDEEAEEPLAPLADPPETIGPEDDSAFVRLQFSYAGVVAYLDHCLGLLLDELRGRNLFDETLILVTTDHGLPLGEHGVVGCGRPWLHDERIHLPLLARLPGGTEAGLRVDALTQTVDLMPTLADAFGVDMRDVHGRSLLPLAREEAAGVRGYACAGLQVGDEIEWAVRTPEWGLLLPISGAAGVPRRPVQLYAKPEDRWEVNNLLQHHLELAENLEKTLRAFVEAAGRPGPLQPPELRIEMPAPAEAAPGGETT